MRKIVFPFLNQAIKIWFWVFLKDSALSRQHNFAGLTLYLTDLSHVPVAPDPRRSLVTRCCIIVLPG